MKKNLSYRDKLLELAEIYKISEIQIYERNKKYLTTGQIELILKKNKVPIPTELKKNIFEIQAKKISKPIFLTGNKIGDFFSSVLITLKLCISKQLLAGEFVLVKKVCVMARQAFRPCKYWLLQL